MTPERFRVHVPDSALLDLRERIGRTRWPDTVRDSGWDYGTDIHTLKRLVHYWLEKFDWRKEEARINSFPQFRLKIEDLSLHFVHIRSSNPEAVPLIMTHGWPGSFLELLKLSPLLQDSFDI